MIPQSFKVAVVQAAPVIFNREKTLAKVKALAGDASALGAKIVLFPEAFVSGYPRGLDFGASSGPGLIGVARTISDIGKAVLIFPVMRQMSSAVSHRATKYSLLSV